MHHSISHHMAKARITDMHHHARRDALALAARRGRRRRPGVRRTGLRL